MGENDRWLGGAGEVETDRDSDCLLSHSAVTHTPPQNQIYDIDIVNRLKLSLTANTRHAAELPFCRRSNKTCTSYASASHILMPKQNFIGACIILCA